MVAWLILATGIVASIIGARAWDRTNDREARQEFEDQADNVHDDVFAQLDRYRGAMLATVGLFDASESVSAPEFASFVERLDLAENYAGVAGISLVHPVEAGGLGEFQAYLDLLEAEDFVLQPISAEGDHAIVSYTAGDALQLGYDLTTIRRMRLALGDSRDTGRTVASTPPRLPTADDTMPEDARGIVIFSPIYRAGLPTETEAQRRAALQAWVATPVEREAFVDAAIGRPDALGVEFVNLSGPGARVVARHPVDLAERRADEPDHVDERAFATYGRSWMLRVEALPAFGSSSAGPWIALAGGIVISILLFALAWILSRMSERRQVHAELTHQALHDPLTGLANRTLFLRILADALHDAARLRRRITVLFIDLDHFKVVNDSLGHDAGNDLLIESARRLETNLGSTERAARLGGDEFAVLLDDVHTEDAALDAAADIADALRVPYVGSDRDLFVPASIGVALSVPDDTHAEELLRNADLAMYRAKELGRDRCELFDDDLRRNVMNRLESEIALHHALDHNEFVVFYQPEVSAADGRVVAAEALLRWWHPDLGPIAPADFIDIAEETGLIVPLGAWVLNEACRQAAAWRRELGAAAPPVVSVNLSARQVARPDLAAAVERALEGSELPPDGLRLEITENVLMTDTRSSMDTVTALHDLGVHLGIDDFGTGYSSLSYLQRFPVDTLKIDQSFVDALGRDESSRAILGSVIVLAHSLGLVATAEGVETRAQLEELRGLGCDQVQGNLLAPPQPAASFRRLLETTPRLGIG